MPTPETDTVLRAGCKINLFLDILRRLDNGYHELRTLLFPLPEPCDLLRVGARASGKRPDVSLLSAPTGEQG